MKINPLSPEEYLQNLPNDKKEAMIALRNILVNHLPTGFVEVMSSGMLGYVVPYTVYAQGYHCNPKQPLPFINLAAQKNHISLYHIGLYASEPLSSWFEKEWKMVSNQKLDKGKSCIRFKKPSEIPLELIARLAEKVTVEQWISIYESTKPEAS
jgi:Domain of unknown function (DU1801)